MQAINNTLDKIIPKNIIVSFIVKNLFKFPQQLFHFRFFQCGSMPEELFISDFCLAGVSDSFAFALSSPHALSVANFSQPSGYMLLGLLLHKTTCAIHRLNDRVDNKAI